MTKTIARLYDGFEDAAQTVRDLESARIPPDAISLIASGASSDLPPELQDTAEASDHDKATAATTGASVGAVAGGGAGLLAGLGMLAIPGLGPVVAAGWLAATTVGAVVGAAAGGAAGGLLAALTENGVSAEEAELYAAGVRHGGTLVTARVADDRAAAVAAIMERNGAVDPAAHRNKAGKTGFDSAPT
jgi:hypothetical protein